MWELWDRTCGMLTIHLSHWLQGRGKNRANTVWSYVPFLATSLLFSPCSRVDYMVSVQEEGRNGRKEWKILFWAKWRLDSLAWYRLGLHSGRYIKQPGFQVDPFCWLIFYLWQLAFIYQATGNRKKLLLHQKILLFLFLLGTEYTTCENNSCNN